MLSSLKEKLGSGVVIENIKSFDIRFPTSADGHGSDAVHKDPDYSAAYVIITAKGLQHEGHGYTFTLGRGTEVVLKAVSSLTPLILGKSLISIFSDFGVFWHTLVNESQLRWIGPEKGVVHLATAAIINALWDLWGKIENKPVWKVLCDLSPEEVVSLVDFTHLTDVLTRDEAIEILKKNAPTRAQREKELKEKGFPAYITSVGWLGYEEDRIRRLCKEAIESGFTRFKMKVGLDIEDDSRRAGIIREEVGWDVPLMMDANQKWDVDYSIDHMTQLAKYKPLWIEEPTSCDDILGHAKIGKALKKYNIGVATGEHCHNRVMFKQFLEASAMDFCQIDSCRLGGVNEIIAVILLAAKFNIPVCPHAGGVGLCEYVSHLVVFDYIYASATLENRMVEFADHLHEHMVSPVIVKGGRYFPPEAPGYAQIRAASMQQYEYPDGPIWKN